MVATSPASTSSTDTLSRTAQPSPRKARKPFSRGAVHPAELRDPPGCHDHPDPKASLSYSFTSYSVLGSPTWIGLDNYQLLSQDPSFVDALIVTLIYTLGAVPLQNFSVPSNSRSCGTALPQCIRTSRALSTVRPRGLLTGRRRRRVARNPRHGPRTGQLVPRHAGVAGVKRPRKPQPSAGGHHPGDRMEEYRVLPRNLLCGHPRGPCGAL